MGSKVKLFVIDYEKVDFPLVHANIDPVTGEGTLCGIKYMDFTAPTSYQKDRKGNTVFELSKDPISCPHCIEYLDAVSGYKRTKEGWK